MAYRQWHLDLGWRADSTLDLSAVSAETVRQLRKLADLGATAVTCSLTAKSADHYCDQLTALRALSDDMGKEPS